MVHIGTGFSLGVASPRGDVVISIEQLGIGKETVTVILRHIKFKINIVLSTIGIRFGQSTKYLVPIAGQ